LLPKRRSPRRQVEWWAGLSGWRQGSYGCDGKLGRKGRSAVSRDAIDAVNARLMDAFERQDAAAVAACYTPDGKLMTPHAEPHVGQEAIETIVAQGFRGGVRHLTLETVALEVIGDVAWEEGLFTTADASGARLDQGKYIVIWKRVGGAWLMARDIMSSNLPPG
jgi:uncharacterized protein (TIGR02246 family)